MLTSFLDIPAGATSIDIENTNGQYSFMGKLKAEGELSNSSLSKFTKYIYALTSNAMLYRSVYIMQANRVCIEYLICGYGLYGITR